MVIVLLQCSFLAIPLDFSSLILLLCLTEEQYSSSSSLEQKSLEVRRQQQMITLLMTALTFMGSSLAVGHYGLEAAPQPGKVLP